MIRNTGKKPRKEMSPAEVALCLLMEECRRQGAWKFAALLGRKHNDAKAEQRGWKSYYSSESKIGKLKQEVLEKTGNDPVL